MIHLITPLLLMVTLMATPLEGISAGFGINATRLIYPEGASSITVTVRNTLTHQPYLVQASLSAKQDRQANAPFVLTPPLFRLEPQSTNQLRIAFMGQPLPADRESVFYLHATAIPASERLDPSRRLNDVQAQLRFGVGSIIKLFYRPASLNGASSSAQGGVKFSRVAGGLKLSNPSPFYINLAGLTADGNRLPLDTPDSLMVPPNGSHIWPVKTLLPAQTRVQWQTINDSGGTDAYSATLP
ncbi:molecular chaperone [Pantoea deleyi]|uniref:fimbrial biogenesis chaperone n=1 Tax=Pantoea deleyi TaxID=470932 RepID=UPI0035D3E474